MRTWYNARLISTVFGERPVHIAPCLSEPPDLAPQEVHLWLCATARISHFAYLEEQCAILSDGELDRLRSARTPQLYRQFLTTRVLLRHLLSAYTAVAPANWRFRVNAHGKPHALCPGPVEPPAFNVSHTSELILIGIGHVQSLGVDIESTQRCVDSLGIAQRYFEPRETAMLRQLPPGQRTSYFYRLWTIKEAYLKARGVGLSMGLDSIRVEGFNDAFFHFEVANDSSCPKSWALESLSLDVDHVGAMCCEDLASGLSAPLLVRSIDPFQSCRAERFVRFHGRQRGRRGPYAPP